MNNEEKEIFQQMILEGNSRLDMIEDSLRMLLVQYMLKECEDAVPNLKNHLENLGKTKKIHVFFNCDEEKSSHSMNVLYNNLAYGDDPEGRNLLLNRVIQERNQKKIIVRLEDMKTIKHMILHENPSESSKYLKYGSIVTMDVCCNC